MMFFDTYAFIEIIEGNKSYEKYIKDLEIFTTRMNLMELYYSILKSGDREKADHFYEKFLPYAVEIDDRVIKEASKFKFLNKIKKLSYIDCLGYTMAFLNGVKFLTGDKEFEGLPGVEFVK